MLSDSAPPPPPAGWYDDPQSSGAQRYWDGKQWAAATPALVAPDAVPTESVTEVGSTVTEAPPTKSRRGLIIAGTVVLVLLVLGGIAAVAGSGSGGKRASSTAASKSPLQVAIDGCSSQKGSEFLQLGDGGRSVIVDTQSKYGSIDALACVLGKIGTPQSIVAEIDSTTALMGQQEDSAGGFIYRWSYHPDNGLNMVIKRS